jgi:endogenous inhibitor of DNA gyrase (YacG/DUF329 family)
MISMVKCPKCGAKGWEYYYPIAILDMDCDDDELTQTNKVKCTECGHEYTIKENFTLTFNYSYNIE